VHSSDEILPYTDPSMTVMDQDTAANLEQVILSLQEILDKHGMKASNHPTASMAKGVCTFAPGDSVFHRLQQAGDDIGMHIHKRSDIQPAHLALT
jgi:hypothetical protein